jgi:hypothetical protein
MDERPKFKCKWCRWERPAWYHDMGLRNGGDALVEHCEMEHPDQVSRLRRALGHDKPAE